jgi:hypothetical protein
VETPCATSAWIREVASPLAGADKIVHFAQCRCDKSRFCGNIPLQRQ